MSDFGDSLLRPDGQLSLVAKRLMVLINGQGLVYGFVLKGLFCLLPTSKWGR